MIHKVFKIFVFTINIFHITAFSLLLQVGNNGAKASGINFNTKAKQAILVDVNTGKILFEKNSKELMSPSSMTKVMTAYMVFDKLKSGEISLDDQLPVSEKAWRKKGTKMFLKVGDHVKVADLIKGIIVLSGNDACIVVAEGLEGSEENFADQMTQKAIELGANTVNFVNASGWPDPDHKCSAHDLMIIARSLIIDFPEQYKKYFSMRTFKYNGIKQFNKLNPILSRGFGADGMKTGYTDDGGYGVIVSSVVRGHRLLAVLNGMNSKRERADEAERIMRWGHRNFISQKLFSAGDKVEEAQTWQGVEATVDLITKKDIEYVTPRKYRGQLVIKAVFKSPIEAPVKKGQKVGELHVSVKGIKDAKIEKFPLYAAKDIERAGFFKRTWNSLYYLVFGHNPMKENKK